MPDMNTSLPDGATATSKDKKSRMVVRGGVWVNDTTYQPTAGAQGPAETSAQDRTALLAASARAAAERDALRTYSQAGKAVTDMGTGPTRARWLDAITPDEDGGIMDTVGAVLGTPFRALENGRTFAARDQLRTVNANVALAGSQLMKGSSSDKDTALMRLSGIGPYKSVEENQRIIRDATYRSGLEQARSLVTSDWIGKYGSLSRPSPNGMTFEQALQVAERSYERRQTARRSGLPKPPPRASRSTPRARQSSGVVTIDINGNPVQ